MKKMLCILFLLTCSINAMVISETYEYSVILDNNDTLLVTGGGAESIIANGNSEITIQNTAEYEFGVGGIASISISGNSMLGVLGGDINDFNIYSYSTATLSGGSINKIFSYQDAYSPNQVHQPHIEIKCREYDDSIANLITGVWDVDNDGDGSYDTFSIELKNQTGYDPVIENIKFTIVPEPCSLVLLGLGGLLIRKK